MNSKITNIIMLATGAAIGSLVTWKLLKTKYEQIAKEEINSVMEVFSKRERPTEVYGNKADPMETDAAEIREYARAAKEKPDISDYVAKLGDLGYTDYSTTSKPETKKTQEVKMPYEPYVISSEAFQESEYDVASLTFYADGVLTDENDEKITDVDYVVGAGSLDTFGEYEEDSVYVRNDRLEVDYEILRDLRNYSDVRKTLPPSEEG